MDQKSVVDGKRLDCSDPSAPSVVRQVNVPNVMFVNQVSPWQLVVETNLWLFLPNPEQLYTLRLTLRQNAFTVKTHVI